MYPAKIRKTVRHRMLFVALSLSCSSMAMAVDTSEWRCESCTFEQGWSGELELGGMHVSDDSYKYGEYTGLTDEGAYVIGNGFARYRNRNAYYMDMLATDLGLDSRSVQVEGGKQGSFELFLKYDQIPHFNSDTAVSPFRGSGSGSLTLPPGWVAGGSTAGMTGLGASLHNVDLDTERKRLELGATLVQNSRWQYGINYRHETKEGTKRAAGTFFLQSAQLTEPVDYVTDEVDVSASYQGRKLQAKFGYYGSFFSNDDRSLTWQNPYSPLFAGTVSGRLALPPENQFHQIIASAGYQFDHRTRITGDFAFGRIQQDNDNFLPATINTVLGSPALPRTSLDGKVNTLTANLSVVSALTDKLRLKAAYRYNDRDNKTPRSSYNWVTTDAFAAAPRSNLPYSFTRSTYKLSADYLAAKNTRLSAGFDYDSNDRSHQDINETKEGTGWGKLTVRVQEKMDVTVKLAHAERDTSRYKPVAEITPPQNPLLRKYNMADRDRDTVGIHGSITPQERLTFGLGVDFAEDKYNNSKLGLKDDQEMSVTGDASFLLSEKTNLYVYANHEKIDSDQRGSQSFSTADWSAKNEDTINTAGLGIKHQLVKDKLDVGLDYSMSRSKGKISVKSGAADPSFPDLETALDSIKLYADYRLRDAISLHAAYWYEYYNADDWMLDYVTPSTISNVLSFGENTPSYRNHILSLSVRYKF